MNQLKAELDKLKLDHEETLKGIVEIERKYRDSE